MSKQRFACAGLAEKHDRHIGFGRERGQLQAARHRFIARCQLFDPEPGERVLHSDAGIIA